MNDTEEKEEEKEGRKRKRRKKNRRMDQPRSPGQRSILSLPCYEIKPIAC